MSVDISGESAYEFQPNTQLQEGINVSLGRGLCSKCTKGVHCFVKVDKSTGEAIPTISCTRQDCPCHCKTHYVCKDCGNLHPYGVNKCTAKEIDSTQLSPESEAELEKINAEWRAIQGEKSQNVEAMVKMNREKDNSIYHCRLCNHGCHELCDSKLCKCEYCASKICPCEYCAKESKK